MAVGILKLVQLKNLIEDAMLTASVEDKVAGNSVRAAERLAENDLQHESNDQDY